MRLGVNIDHVATVRNARRTFEPDPVYAAILAQMAGAHQITLHVREDRRHVNEDDLRKIIETVHIPVNLEMAPTEEMRNIALTYHPNRVTLVPERREEITTEGGLDVVSHKEYLKEFIKPFKEAGIEVSLFIDPDLEQIKASVWVEADAVELHTGTYAEAWNSFDREGVERELAKLRAAAKFAKSLGLRVYAGHGLTYHNVKPITQIEDIEELNIGHSIVANAVLLGFERAVKDMLKLLK
ncbi:MAG TPA: pyridoxine 5'-phosphate synthase [Aquifex aeolicus]|uniref:Pyridoxine 5'-phosphate synthase n=1 Tax=Aquifex aeolicus TaxID=63363 RepID=A0A9D1CFE9_AQUAO|nr:pyridoxine 5'-phosphate synthase [Aquificales bacterium]HIP98815.1 pyridoxine 5'-phosphate synthase [Aquifex aeolicus]HIQ25780.1 pyridoxine 5'-phosphate synthase [Aquifex aeolicus]